MSTTTALMTVSDFLRVPEPKEGHHELHHGKLVLMAPPKSGHERIQERLREILSQMIRGSQAAMVVRVEMAFQPGPEYEVWRADVGVVSTERDANTPDDAYLQGAPELVIEVLSPSNTVEEIEDKMTTCLKHGCQSFWLVDGNWKEVRVTGSDFVTQRYSTAESIPLGVLPGAVSVRGLFT